MHNERRGRANNVSGLVVQGQWGSYADNNSVSGAAGDRVIHRAPAHSGSAGCAVKFRTGAKFVIFSSALFFKNTFRAFSFLPLRPFGFTRLLLRSARRARARTKNFRTFFETVVQFGKGVLTKNNGTGREELLKFLLFMACR